MVTIGKTTAAAKLHKVAAVISSLLMFSAMPVASASEFDASSGFAGPDATENTIAADRAPTVSIIKRDPLEAWNSWNKAVTDKTGIAFKLDYSAVGLALRIPAV